MRTPSTVIRALTGSRFETISSRWDVIDLWLPAVTWNLLPRGLRQTWRSRATSVRPFQ
jgi:hypothetical protein